MLTQRQRRWGQGRDHVRVSVPLKVSQDNVQNVSRGVVHEKDFVHISIDKIGHLLAYSDEVVCARHCTR